MYPYEEIWAVHLTEYHNIDTTVSHVYLHLVAI